MRDIFKISIVSVAFIAMPFFGNAQVLDNSLTLITSPEFPQAHEQYTIKFNVFNAERASIVWLINGVESQSDQNSNEVALEAGNIGEQTRIVAKITDRNGIVHEAVHTVTPSRVDLIIEADTVVPPFYKGRRLPSSGSEVTATALVFTKDGLSSQNYSYVWRVDNVIQNGGPIKGKNTFVFTPSFEKGTMISVDVLDAHGRIIARETQLIPIVEPELYFYEKNPLRGLSFTALADPYVFIGEEATIRAEGYFMSRDMLDNNVLREWKINNRTVSHETDPNEITIKKEGGSGSAELSFHVRNLRQLLQGVEEKIIFKF